MARWTKKILVFAITRPSEQVVFIEKLRRKIKCDFTIQAGLRGLTLTFRGAQEQIRLCVRHARDIFNETKDSYAS